MLNRSRQNSFFVLPVSKIQTTNEKCAKLLMSRQVYAENVLFFAMTLHCFFFYRRKTISQCSIQMTKSFVLSDFFRRTEIIEIKWMIISNSEKHLCWSKLMNVTRKFPSKVSQEHMYKCMLHSFCLGFCLSNAITKHISKHAMAKQKIPFIVNNTKTHQYDMAEQMCVKSQMNY